MQHFLRQDVVGEGVSLPPGFLSHILTTTVEDALFQIVGCPPPPNRPDLQAMCLGTDENYINHQITVVEECLVNAPNCPKDVDKEALLAIGAFTLESSIYKLLNGWGNLTQRSVEDLKYVAPYMKVLISALRRLPGKYKYEGFGVRILDASIPVLKGAFENYKEYFGKGRSVNFHSVCSFGRDENMLKSFIERDTPIIVLQCANVEGYLIEDISMMPRLGFPNEGEIIVEGPSFFTVTVPPVKIRNYVVVQIEYNSKKGMIFSYLPRQSQRSRNRGETEIAENETKEKREREKKEKKERESEDKLRIEKDREAIQKREREEKERKERARIVKENEERIIREREEKRKDQEREDKERQQQTKLNGQGVAKGGIIFHLAKQFESKAEQQPAPTQVTKKKWTPPPASRVPPPAGTPTPSSKTPELYFYPPPYPSSELYQATTLFTFEAEQPTDLSFQEGDVIYIIEDTDPSGWWKGRDKFGNEGFFPMNFVRK